MLADVSSNEFMNAERNGESLSELRKKGEDETNKGFRIKKGKLVGIVDTNRGEERVQLYVPLKYREGILNVCHDEIAGHLGVTKTKDWVLAYYFWPQCYKEIEDYVRSCHVCQVVGHNREKEGPSKISTHNFRSV